MSVQQALYCSICEKKTVHNAKKTNHILHLLLSVLTAGLWLIVWLFVADNNSHKRVCANCGLETSARDHHENKGKSGKALMIAAAVAVGIVVAPMVLSYVFSLFN